MKKDVQVLPIDSFNKHGMRISILIIGLMFFIFGIVFWVNSILIVYFKIACEFTNFQAYFVTFAFYISYFIISILTSYLLKSTGFKME